jgi:hypothetical protein
MAVSTGRSVALYSRSDCSLHLAMDLAFLLYIQGVLGSNSCVPTHFLTDCGLLVCDAVYSGK